VKSVSIYQGTQGLNHGVVLEAPNLKWKNIPLKER